MTDATQELQQLPRFSAAPVTLLGNGSFGWVYLVQDATSNRRKQRAVKLIPRTTMTHHNVREVLNHYKLFGHAHVVGFKDVFLTPDFLCIVMEYANKGNLLKYILDHRNNKTFMSEDEIRHLFQQLIIAVDYFHSKGISSRDIKPDNLLLHEDSTGHLLLKVCDFGYSKDETFSLAMTARVGTPSYMPPEVYEVPEGGVFDGKAVDVWSCGVVLYTMMYGKFPFGPEPQTEQARVDMLHRMRSRIYNLGHQPDYSEGCKNLVRRMLEPSIAHRIRISEILADPWFRQGIDDRHLCYNASIPELPRAQSLLDVSRVLWEAVPPNSSYGQRIRDLLQRELNVLHQAGC